jgi:hypothetical protein
MRARLLAVGLLLCCLSSSVVQAARINGNLVVTGSENYCLDTGSVNAYACNLLYTITSYVTGATYRVKLASTNTGAATVNLNAVGTRPIRKFVLGALVDVTAGDLCAGEVLELKYDGTAVAMQLVNPPCDAPAIPGDVTSNTATSVDGEAMLFAGTTGKSSRRATGTGAATLTAGVLGVASGTGAATLTGGVLGVASGTGLATLTGGVLGTTAAPPGAVTGTIASGTTALATASIASGACGTIQTATATGAASTDVVIASFNARPSLVAGYTAATTGTLRVDVWLSTNTVNIEVCNNTQAAIVPGALSLNWRVVR